ncbi:MAG: DUF4124 domain-containing protein [Candidatus Competibacteraceae bacterium]
MHPRLLSLVAFSLTASAMTVLPPATAGDLYKWTDDKGRVHYSSTPPPDNAKKAATLDSRKLSNINALPNDPHKDRADSSGPTDNSNASELETPVQTSSSDSAPASPPVLIPPLLLAQNSPPAAAKPEQPAQPDIVEVVAQGMGIDVNSALLNAYSNAVQQALGLYVDAETLVQNDQIVQDKILTYSKGFIQEATTVKQSQVNGLFQVNIRAKVKRQQLLEQAKANNITVKAVEGVSLHAQVESQVKQEKDAKALLEKAFLPLIVGTDLHRADIVPSTKEQPNPIINKEKSDDNFVTLDYKVRVWIDVTEYLKYLKNNLFPILNQIAVRKKPEFTLKIESNDDNNEFGYRVRMDSGYNEKEIPLNILTYRDKAITMSKWQSFIVPKDIMPQQLVKNDGNGIVGCGRIIELSLLDENNEIVSLGNKESSNHCTGGNSFSPIGIDNYDFMISYDLRSQENRDNYTPNSIIIISVKIDKADLPRVKSAKLEIKIVEGKQSSKPITGTAAYQFR